jgi:hypothetical protein
VFFGRQICFILIRRAHRRRAVFRFVDHQDLRSQIKVGRQNAQRLELLSAQTNHEHRQLHPDQCGKQAFEQFLVHGLSHWQDSG